MSIYLYKQIASQKQSSPHEGYIYIYIVLTDLNVQSFATRIDKRTTQYISQINLRETLSYLSGMG
jgi:hypothetical protein